MTELSVRRQVTPCSWWRAPLALAALCAATTAVSGCETDSSAESQLTAPAQATADTQEVGNPIGNPDPLDSTDPRQLATASSPERPRQPQPFTHATPPARTKQSVPKPVTTLSLRGRFQWRDKNTAPRLASLEPEVRERALDTLGRGFGLELSPEGAMRWDLEGGAFPVSQNTSLLGHINHYGNLLVWPDRKQYRVLPRGALLALIREGRADVAPLVNTQVETQSLPKDRAWGYSMQRHTLTTERGTVSLDMATIAEADAGAVPWCRALVELIAAAAPETVCVAQQVPLRATYQLDEATLDLRIEGINLSTESPSRIEIPPSRAKLATHTLPERKATIANAELRRALLASEGEGSVRVINTNAVAAYVLLRETPIALLAPHSELRFQQLPLGDHSFELRDFFGRVLLPPRTVTLDPSAVLSNKPMDVDGGVPAEPAP